MQLTKSLFSLLTLISAAAAVVVPTDLADGFYSLKRGGDGKTIATKLGITLNLTASSGGKRSLPDGMAHLERRDLWGSTGRTFPADQQANYDKCTRGWRNWLRWNGGKVPSGEIYTLVIGQAALTGCNYNSGSFDGFLNLDIANGYMDKKFGWWKTGWYLFQPFGMTFWRDLRGVDVCTNL